MKRINLFSFVFISILLLSSCSTTQSIDESTHILPPIELENSIDIHKVYELYGEEVTLDIVPGTISVCFPSFVTDEDINYFLLLEGSKYSDYAKDVTFEINDSTLVLNYPKIYTEDEVIDIVNQIVIDIRKNLGFVENDEEDSFVISNYEIEKELTNDMRSYDPENYDYTFGLIPPESLSINFASHLYLDTVMLYGYPTVGATWDFGLSVDTVTIATYVRYSHFFRPLGSSTGKLYVGEEMGELGLSFKVRLYELGRFNVNIGINTGWYQQWLMYVSSDNTYNLVNNGLMIRPEASIGWNWVGLWTMELGVFYQTPLYPSYEGYQGWGVYLKVL